jgi:diguanylate cyclase (GGDEF)-like protein
MSGRPWRLSAKLLIASSIATVIGFSAICVNVMLDMRRGEAELARQSLENLASTIDADINRNIELYDLSLRAVAGNMVIPEIKDAPKTLRHLILFHHAAMAKHFGAIQAFDARGQLTNDASSLDPVPENRADDEFFRIHRDHPDFGLYISRPMLYRGAYSVVLSRRVADADGRFLGVVAGSIRFSYFHDLFGNLKLDPDDMICVLRRDGTLIMRVPFDLDLIGINVGDKPVIGRVFAERSGSFEGAGAFDTVPRLMVWRDSTHPLVVLVGKPWNGILKLWRIQAIRMGAIMLTLVAFTLAATLFLAYEIDRRAKAEDKLEEMATTDGLTGLPNRRKFDATIDSEWRRAIRSRSPISVLMIDADHFKAYNDTFGHQAGDQVLIGIAICISDSVRRAGDCAARYGGEEFSVLLPGTAGADALKIAETIRNKVVGWSEAENASTVSIGVASIVPSSGMDWTQLVHAADTALYAAKAAGRNRCMVAQTAALPLAA